jgi:hypothetical protein
MGQCFQPPHIASCEGPLALVEASRTPMIRSWVRNGMQTRERVFVPVWASTLR